MKECTTCGVIKSLSEFSNNGNGRLKAVCRVCVAADARQRARTSKVAGIFSLPFQPTAEAHRVWMRWEREIAA